MDNLRVEDVEDDGTVVFSLFLGPEFLHVGGETKQLATRLECCREEDSQTFTGSLHGGAATLILGTRPSIRGHMKRITLLN